MTRNIFIIATIILLSSCSSSFYLEDTKYNPNQYKFTRITLIVAKDLLIGDFSANIANDFQTKFSKCGIETKVFIKDLSVKDIDSTALHKVIQEFNPNGVFFISPNGVRPYYKFGGILIKTIYFPCRFYYRDDSGHYTLIYSTDMYLDPGKINNAWKDASEKLYNSISKYNGKISCP